MDFNLTTLIRELTYTVDAVNEILNGSKSIEFKTSASGTKVFSVIPCPFRRPN